MVFNTFNHCQCCCCSEPITGTINTLMLDKAASWEYPTWGNVLPKDGSQSRRVISVVCDDCLLKELRPCCAVEFQGDRIIYHPLDNLKDLPPITPDMLEGQP